MSLENWLQNGWLIPHQISRQEINDLLAIADRDLHDCLTSGLSPDWKLNIAYNAALQLANAALIARGYRAARDCHHYRVIQSLQFTVEAPLSIVIQFDQFRKKRNIGGYERAGMVSEQESSEMVDLAKQLREIVIDWLRSSDF